MQCNAGFNKAKFFTSQSTILVTSNPVALRRLGTRKVARARLDPQTEGHKVYEWLVSRARGPYGGPVVHSDVASVAETQLFRILSALCPHYFRSLSAPFPQHLRILSALFPWCLRTVAAVLPQSSFSQELQYSYTAERFSCLGRFI